MPGLVKKRLTLMPRSARRSWLSVVGVTPAVPLETASRSAIISSESEQLALGPWNLRCVRVPTGERPCRPVPSRCRDRPRSVCSLFIAGGLPCQAKTTRFGGFFSISPKMLWKSCAWLWKSPAAVSGEPKGKKTKMLKAGGSSTTSRSVALGLGRRGRLAQTSKGGLGHVPLRQRRLLLHRGCSCLRTLKANQAG
jgi:hypothetical protein